MSGERQQVRLTWTDAMRFEGRGGDGVVTTVDGEGSRGPSPTRLLLESLGGCAGIDVVEILRKGRQELEGLEVVVEGTRRPRAPRRFTRVVLRFVLRGDVDRGAAERAVDLSLERYCSVFHTLRMDMAVETEVVLE